MGACLLRLHAARAIVHWSRRSTRACSGWLSRATPWGSFRAAAIGRASCRCSKYIEADYVEAIEENIDAEVGEQAQMAAASADEVLAIDAGRQILVTRLTTYSLPFARHAIHGSEQPPPHDPGS
jgi:hypothetical protein